MGQHVYQAELCHFTTVSPSARQAAVALRQLTYPAPTLDLCLRPREPRRVLRSAEAVTCARGGGEASSFIKVKAQKRLELLLFLVDIRSANTFFFLVQFPRCHTDDIESHTVKSTVRKTHLFESLFSNNAA